ncbi:MAG: hypothetical protein HFJ28_04320 [Clostridia bacterium]|jgi:DNA-binding protein Fis|nr:hypothetical protein [Clostridia bacterium]
MANNSLMPVKEGIFTKIKNWWKDLFGKEPIEPYHMPVTNLEMPQEKVVSFAREVKIEETQEQRLNRLQQALREKRITQKEIEKEDKELLRKLYDKQIQELKESIIEKQNKILQIKYEQKRKAHNN